MRRNALILAGCAVVLVGVAAGVVLTKGRDAAPPPEYTLRGTVTVPADEIGSVGDTCGPAEGYHDVVEGDVTVRNQGGDVVGLGPIGGGAVTTQHTTCVFHFVVRELPQARFYQLQLGRSQRDPATFSYAELARRGWDVELTVGPS